MAQHFRVGISGGGVIGAIHAAALANIDSVELVAVAEPREDAGRAFIAKYGGTHYTSYLDMLAHPDLDVVIVATPSGLHPDQVVMAAEAGKHVITEKPMAITSEGLDRMIQAANDAEVELAVIFQNRLSTDVVRVKRALEQGTFGKPVLANGTMYWHRDQTYYDANGGWRGTWALDGGGALMNQAIHCIDLLQWLMDGVQEIKAFTSTLNHAIETEDTAAAVFVYGNGALGSITATTCSRDDQPQRIEIIGTAGKLTLNGTEIVQWDCPIPPEEIELTPEDHALVDGWSAGEEWGNSHERQLRAIFGQLEAGQTPYVTGTEARVAVDIVLGIYANANG